MSAARLPQLALLMALAGTGAAGCETFGPRTCDTSPGANPLVEFTGGETKNGVYMSSPWDGGEGVDGGLLSFPAGMRYSLVHGLGVAPAWIQAYLSFDRGGTRDGGTLAQAAGNQAEIVGVDASAIQVVNDSCSDYWLLVVAGAGSAPPGP